MVQTCITYYMCYTCVIYVIDISLIIIVWFESTICDGTSLIINVYPKEYGI